MAKSAATRVPPNDNKCEIALLGSVLLKNKVIDDVEARIQSSDFYQLSHQKIWEAFLGMRKDLPGVTIDSVSLLKYVSEKGMLEDCGGAAYISKLTSSVPVYENASYYADIIKNLSIKRQLLYLSVEIGDSVFDETQDVKFSIDKLDSKLSELSTNSDWGSYSTAKDILTAAVHEIVDVRPVKGKVGISTGFKSLNHMLAGGFKNTDLIIIGARPSVGKTALALSMAHNMAFNRKDPVKVGFFSLEMSGQTLMERLIAREATVDATAMSSGKLTPDMSASILNAADRMYDMAGNLLIQDTPNISLAEIKSQSRRMVRKEGVKIIFIDYIGLIEPDGNTQKKRFEQMAEVSRSLKSLARELKVPIVCLSQVNRDAGKDRAPMLADLRESGAIEQDADVVILLDDPSKRLDENNKIAQYEEDDAELAEEAEAPKEKPSKNVSRVIKVIIAKQRNGSTGAVNLMFRANFVSFNEIERVRTTSF
ncbi:MAG: replicative DNA helicase [Sphaerochaetaceae bacterium]|nr:replicative DNA helicase [Sphaerochaetaceae bacterium]